MLEVRALGRLEAFYRGSPLQLPTQKTLELLCYLLMHSGRRVHRCTIAEALWPMRPPGKARRSLSTALWRLRRALRAVDVSAPKLFLAQRQFIALDPAMPVRFDVAEFEHHVQLGLAQDDASDPTRLEQLEIGTRLYEGPLLAGVYSDWCLGERERLQLLFLRSLRQLLTHYRLTGAFEAALSMGRRLLTLDPLQEDVHREIMRCYVASGRRALALEQYECCREVLRRELRIEPMTETRALSLQIRQGPNLPVTSMSVGEPQSPYLAALGRFRDALAALEESWEALQSIAPDVH